MLSSPHASATSAQHVAVTDPSAAAAAARRAKKRDQDRRCQRTARERTKNRLAYLEGLVADLKQQNATKQVETLWKERDQLTTERDAMAQTLRTIERALRSNRAEWLATGQAVPNALESQALASSQGHGSSRSNVNESLLPHSPPSNNILTPALYTQTPASERWPILGQDASVDAQEQIGLTCAIQSAALLPNSTGQPERNVTSTNMVWSQEDPAILCPRHEDAIVPCPMSTCECSPVPLAPAPNSRELNLWRFANETLTERTEWSALISMREHALEDDTPIRAMIEGWDAVEKRAGGDLPPSWRILRRIDETLFSACAKTERLAILRVMHSLFRYHQEPSPDRRKALPNWYLARPSQNIAHSYAIDYFAWPGLRERFVFHQHHYCSNRFWSRFSSDLRILWPYEFRDCYSLNLLTGEYKINTAFQERIEDIRAWTMSADIFKIWPEFLSDIPVYDSILEPLTPALPVKRIGSACILETSGSADSIRTGHVSEGMGEENDDQGNRQAGSQSVDSQVSLMLAESGFQLDYEFTDSPFLLAPVEWQAETL